MEDTTNTHLALLGAVVLTLRGMHVLISQPAERRAEQRFERIEARLDKMDVRFDRIDERFDRVDERFREVDKRFDVLERSIDERVDRLETNLAITTGRLDWEQEQKQQE